MYVADSELQVILLIFTIKKVCSRCGKRQEHTFLFAEVMSVIRSAGGATLQSLLLERKLRRATLGVQDGLQHKRVLEQIRFQTKYPKQS